MTTTPARSKGYGPGPALQPPDRGRGGPQRGEVLRVVARHPVAQRQPVRSGLGGAAVGPDRHGHEVRRDQVGVREPGDGAPVLHVPGHQPAVGDADPALRHVEPDLVGRLVGRVVVDGVPAWSAPPAPASPTPGRRGRCASRAHQVLTAGRRGGGGRAAVVPTPRRTSIRRAASGPRVEVLVWCAAVTATAARVDRSVTTGQSTCSRLGKVGSGRPARAPGQPGRCRECGSEVGVVHVPAG